MLVREESMVALIPPFGIRLGSDVCLPIEPEVGARIECLI